MKNILVAVDFSSSAENALQYAANFAENMNASITIFNCFHIPVTVSEVPTMSISVDSLREDALTALNNRKKDVLKKHPLLKVKTDARAGFAGDEILDYAKTHKIDLIILGIKGSNALSEVVIGSNATQVAKNAECPVLIIPSESRFKKPTKIALTFDLKKISNSHVFDFLKLLVNTYNSHVHTISIIEPENVVTVDQATAGVKLDHMLGEIKHTMHIKENENVEEGITLFAKEHSINMLCVLRRKYSFLENIFHTSNTKKIAFHTDIPLLVLHEKN